MLGLGNSITGGAALDTAFAPADFGNLDIHYDFSLLSGSNGDAISSFANGGAAGGDYDLRQTTASNQPTIDTSKNNYVTVSDQAGRSSTRFFYADPDIITQPPEKEISLPSEYVKFFLNSSTLQQLQRAASVYQLPDLCLYGDGTEMSLCVTDKKNDTSNSYSVQVGQTTEEFCYCFKVENLKLLLADYDVTISSANVALFQGDGIKYFIALEPNA